MFQELGEHPGLWFVAATVMPAASFVMLLLAGGVHWMLRPARESAAGESSNERPKVDRGRIAAYVATGAMALAFLCSLIGAIQFFGQSGHGGGEHAEMWAGNFDWTRISVPVDDHSTIGRASMLRLGYHIDSLTVVMFLMVTLIAGLIHLFSIGYMSDELEPIVEDHQVHTETGHLKRRGRFGRFFLFMSLFCFSMLNLVLADNLFQVFLSWELVGICSYLLIGFYHERRSASNAANKAFITNRIGDAGFIIGLLILWTYLGTFNFEEIFQRLEEGSMPHWLVVTAGLGVFLGCVGK